ncbi:MAG TPA: TM0106 family RecB-like putative nuclease [Gaiellaceae bacterium]
MHVWEGRVRFSPSDLSGFLACPHLTTLELRVARSEIPKPYRHDPHAELIRRKGSEHEERYLQHLRADTRDVVTIGFDDRDWDRAARETEDAIRGGADVVYQACLSSGDWRGFADFVERQPDGSCEVVDIKLARHARPTHILQLCSYTQEVARIQGFEPGAMHVVTGLGARETYRPGDFDAYYRRVRQRFLDAIEHPRETYPYPVEHCSLCDFLGLCSEQWERDDHLTLVASIARRHVAALTAAGIATLERLGELPPGTAVPGIRAATLATIRHQAELQLHRRRTGQHRVAELPLEPERGFGLLPKPDDGDVWLDVEGDPWFAAERGLEFLFGWVHLDGGEPRYECIWARDREEERRGFERLLDFLTERRRRFPGMHVYHYAPYERTALSRLMGAFGTREDALDDLLRGEVLVDLFRVTRQAVRASVPSYSIKDIEEVYAFERAAAVKGGGGAAVGFETWLETADDSILETIERYNEEDCRSLYELHRWLLGMRPSDLEWRPPPEQREQKEETQERRADLEALKARLLAHGHDLLANPLEYHRREEKPQWWEYFHHRSLDEEELIEDGDTIGGIELVGDPELDRRSLVYTLRFPPQEHKIGREGVDPATEKSYGVRIDDERGLITLRRAKNRAAEPLPRALIPPQPLGDYEQRDAVKRFAEDYLAGSPRWPALRDVLERRPPRVRLDDSPIEAALSLDRSYLFVQGPPGSGKTHTGADMAVALIRAGKRVGVASLSHKAINNFLAQVERAAAEQRYAFKGRKKFSDPEDAFEGGRFIDNRSRNEELLDPALQLLAGTSWLFADEKLDDAVDVLFVDEGGQVSLADALAVGTAAQNLVLLGDPNQLAQVSQGTHPPGANASVLSHLLADDETLRPDMGLFLAETWRLRPEVNDYISGTFYEGRLQPAPRALERWLDAGHGIRFLVVEHSGHRRSSPEEAGAVAAEIAGLLGSRYVDGDEERTLEPRDVVIVAPYNAHVRCLRQQITDTRIRIGTVDKFQGQEAPVVFFSMASSSGEEIPRGMEFLFSRNRLNVAISRAKCLAYLVATPRLLEIECRTVEQMRLANALCRLVEVAEEQPRAMRM